MKLTLIKVAIVAKGTKSFYFTPEVPFTWQAGQYINLKLGEISRDFTIASSPTEGSNLMITVRLRENSEFKKLLDNLQIGSIVEADGPFGSFVFPLSSSPSTNHIFLAGGIGITPFRSMIKYNVDSKINNPIFLVYSNSDSEFVFKDELDKWQNESNGLLKVIYNDTSVVGRIDKMKIEKLLTKNSVFWIVGPKLFVNAMEDILEELQIPQDNIKVEKFTGY